MHLLQYLRSLNNEAETPNQKEINSIVSRISGALIVVATNGGKERTLDIRYRDGMGNINGIYRMHNKEVRESCHRKALAEALKAAAFDGIKVEKTNGDTYIFSW
tara:strand:+ start:428 stop:739 length:312 start_codon:yes stop_codon:yes gene_type:complete